MHWLCGPEPISPTMLPPTIASSFAPRSWWPEASGFASTCSRAVARGPFFLSLSRRNRAQPITIWTWSKVVERVADRAGTPRCTTHTFRHLCLTDLARAGWDVHEIARFAGHRSPATTLQHLHLSGRDLAAKLARGMAEVHTWRAALTAEALG